MAAVVLAVAMLAGCSSSSGEGFSSGDSGGAGGGAAVPAAPDEISGGAPGVPVVDDDTDRQVVTTATSSVLVEDPRDTAQQVSELVESVGGRVEERNEQAASEDGEGAVADLVVRVPASELTGVLAELEDLGAVQDVSVSRSDVTGTAVDLDARISALQTSVARLQSLMDDAGSTEALLAAESALSGRQEQLEALQSQRASLGDQVALSTLSVHLEPVAVAAAGGDPGFVDGLSAGWDALVAVGSAVVVVVGTLLPWVPVALVLAGAVVISRRLAQRRRALRTPAPVPSPQA
jgi:hypothetical protein